MSPCRLVGTLAGLIAFTFADRLILHDYAGLQNGVYGSMPSQTYRSSNITSPLFNYNTWRKDLVAGAESSHILLTLKPDLAGPYLFADEDLSLVYADPSFDSAMNAQVQLIDDEPYLSFWHGAKDGGQGQGYCVFYNNRYELKYNLTTGSPLRVGADMHECQVTGSGSVLLTAYQDRIWDLSPLGGEVDDILADSCFQEIDFRNNTVIFSWCATDHFSPDLTFWNYTSSNLVKKQSSDTSAPDPDALTSSSGFDAYHINSLQKTTEGNYLIALRNLKQICYIDGATGKPIWNLGGRPNDFADVTPPSVLAANPNSDGAMSFGWHHHVRFWDDSLTQITLFDNHDVLMSVNCTGITCSRGRRLQIDTSDPDNLTVELVRDYRSPQGLKSAIMGSMQPIMDPLKAKTSDLGYVLLGWGDNAEFSEYTSDGSLVRDVQFSPLDPRHTSGGGIGWSSYRTFKQSWHGYPTWAPSIATDSNGTLWVSWNGATEVHEWALYGAESEASLGEAHGSSNVTNGISKRSNLVEIMEREGFETEILMTTHTPEFVKVVALDDNGNAIGSTDTIETGFTPSLTSQPGCLFQDSLSLICLVRLLV